MHMNTPRAGILQGTLSKQRPNNNTRIPTTAHSLFRFFGPAYAMQFPMRPRRSFSTRAHHTSNTCPPTSVLQRSSLQTTAKTTLITTSFSFSHTYTVVALIQVALQTSEHNELARGVSDAIARVNAALSSLTYQPIIFLYTQESRGYGKVWLCRYTSSDAKGYFSIFFVLASLSTRMMDVALPIYHASAWRQTHADLDTDDERQRSIILLRPGKSENNVLGPWHFGEL